MEAFKQWRVYLEGAAHPICVFSDHKNLEYFSSDRTTSRRHARWAATLAAYLYTITYRKGVSNDLIVHGLNLFGCHQICIKIRH